MTARIGGASRLRPPTTAVVLRRISFSDQDSLFIPSASSQIAAILGTPTGYDVLTDPGQAPRIAVQAPRIAVQATADRLGVPVFLESITDYQAVQGYQLLLSTLAVIVRFTSAAAGRRLDPLVTQT
jgi:hypothetical protein